MTKAFAFTGPSNSGKTTLICKISKFLQDQNYKVAIIKHDPKDKAAFDQNGKDSFKFYSTGADVAVISPTRTTQFYHQPLDILELIASFKADLVLVEGLKTLPLPRLGVFCKEIDESYLPHCIALASYLKPEGDIKHFHLDDIKAIADFVILNSKEI